MTYQDFENYFLNKDEKAYKAKQVYDWLYKKRVTKIEDMYNIKKQLREDLKKDFSFDEITLLDQKEGTDVTKFLFRLADNQVIEAVLMFHDYGNSLCVSSQVGCNMGCTFCESGRRKKVRNLETFEMVLQILMIEKIKQLRISHVVLMGIGEPFDNYENVVAFLKIINNDNGLAIGARHITVSTCGIIPKIKQFMELPFQINLAISLHAPSNELRSEIMPINRAYPLNELLPVLKQYIKKTNRRLTFEYILLKDVNDSEEEALKLCQLLKGINCYVNLIPYNETSHIVYKKSKKETILKFYDILKKNKINVTIRREFGSEVMAACGQLRSKYEEG